MESNECERFLDEILRRGPVSKDLEAHLQTCDECRGLQRTLDSLGAVDSAYPAAPFASLRQKVLANALPPVAAPPLPTASPVLPILFACSVVLLLGAVIIFRISPTGNNLPGEIISGVEAPGSRMLQIASGTTTIQSPDGSIVTLTGPAAATLSNRELSLFWGAANIRVASGPMPFRLTLRDGHAGMVSGEFRVIVSAIATEIEVQTGRLSTTPRESSPLTIGPGEKIALKNAAKSPLDASASSVLDVFLLDSENEISPPDSAVGER